LARGLRNAVEAVVVDVVEVVIYEAKGEWSMKRNVKTSYGVWAGCGRTQGYHLDGQVESVLILADDRMKMYLHYMPDGI
jgi:hypothetical protein